MLDRNQNPDQHQHLITDNLWSAPAYFDYYSRDGLVYTLSVKVVGGPVPDSLIELAGSDLPMRHSRTYARGDQIIQLLDCGNHNTTLISNSWRVNIARPTIREIHGSYKSALALYQNERAATLVDLFRLPETWKLKTNADIIFEATGWDVLRAEDKQGESAPLSWELCESLTRKQVLDIYTAKFKPKRLAQNTSKKKLMQLMFPHHTDIEPVPKAAKRKHEVSDLGALRVELRGESTSSHSVYDTWHLDNTDIDRMDQDYAMFYCTSGHYRAEKQGLESIIFFMMMSVRALWEEHHCQVIFDQSGGKRSAVPFRPVYTIPRFIYEVGASLVTE